QLADVRAAALDLLVAVVDFLVEAAVFLSVVVVAASLLGHGGDRLFGRRGLLQVIVAAGNVFIRPGTRGPAKTAGRTRLGFCHGRSSPEVSKSLTTDYDSGLHSG